MTVTACSAELPGTDIRTCPKAPSGSAANC